MATLTLDRFWVNLMSDGSAVAAFTEPKRTRRTSVVGDVRTYAGGRRRAVSAEGVEVTYDVTLVRLTDAQAKTLESWLGRPTQIRDHRGQRYVGTFFTLTVSEHPDWGYRASFTFQGTTE